ncbi:MAG: hypothetical protein Q8927_08625 [Bacteroidota bacterium]|nr:hypothetical protein [Bacteroidota bacterium]MDP4253701.1 hypothetical protein [Bacteroidota bacterium]MDP4259985.1 hypothetical protein [Bacteroidota bacterium]
MQDAFQRISSAQAMDLILQGQPLRNFYVEGNVDLHENEKKLNHRLFIEQCTIENLIGLSVEFKHSVTLVASSIRKCSFNYAYFFDGLTIDNCSFNSYVDFEAGGHNNRPILIKNSTFSEFVNFFDCWFHGEVIVVNNHFPKGTNLMGNLTDMGGVEFVVPPVIENNTGSIDLDGDGDRPVNIINLLKFD